MKFKIVNLDKQDSLIVSAIKTAKDSYDLGFLNPEPPKRVKRAVLRPGEQEVYLLEEGYIASVEIL